MEVAGRYCTDAEGRHDCERRSVAAHFQSPCTKKKMRTEQRRLGKSKIQKFKMQRQSASMETREDPEPSAKSMKSSQDDGNEAASRAGAARLSRERTERKRWTAKQGLSDFVEKQIVDEMEKAQVRDISKKIEETVKTKIHGSWLRASGQAVNTLSIHYTKSLDPECPGQT